MDKVYEGLTVPLGIPSYFIADRVAAGERMQDSMSNDDRHSLFSEYRSAVGYPFAWGHVVEEHRTAAGIASRGLLWHCVPIAFWMQIDRVTVQGKYQTIEEVIAQSADFVNRYLRAQSVPRGVLLICNQDYNRRRPHTLFSVLCQPGIHEPALRTWLVHQVIERTLPNLLDVLRNHLTEVRSTPVEAVPAALAS